MVAEGTRAESAPDWAFLMSTQWLGERTAFHIRQDSCLCLKQVVSKACWKGQRGLAPRAGCGMSLLSQGAASMQKWIVSSMEKDAERKGSKGIETHRLSVFREELGWLWCEDGILYTQQSAEWCLKNCKQANFEEAWKHQHEACVEAETHLPVQLLKHLSKTASVLHIVSIHLS